MFCKNCGTQLGDNALFCSQCGEKVFSVAEPVTENSFDNETSAPTEELLTAETEELLENEDEKSDFYEEPMQEFNTMSVEPLKIVEAAKAWPLKKKLFGVVALIVVLAIIGGIIGYASSKNERIIKKALETENLNSITSIYFAGSYDERVKYDKVIVSYLDEIYDKIKDFEIDGSQKSWNEVITNQIGLSDSQSDFIEELVYELKDSSSSISNAFQKLEDICYSKKGYFDALKNAENKEYANALSSLEDVLKEDAMYDEAQKLISTYTKNYIDEVLKNVDKAIADGDYNQASELLNEAKSKFSNNATILAKIDEVTASNAASYAAKAEEFFKSNEIEAAIGNINVALELVPDNAEYKASLEKYKLYLPFDLGKESNIFYSTDFELEKFDKVTANTGTIYENVSGFGDKADYVLNHLLENTITYKLDGKYDVITGTLFLPEKEKNNGKDTYFSIYGDGKLLYKSSNILAGFIPTELKINCSGVKELKIVTSTHYSPYIYISNFQAQKTVK